MSERRTAVRGGRVVRAGLVVAAGAGALTVLAAFLAPDRAMHAWLTAYAFGLSLALGTLALVMIGWVTDARWFVAVRRPAEAVAATLPLFALLALPILLWPEALYPWALDPAVLPEHVAREIEKKRAYLSGGFFVLRSVVYLLAWSVLGSLLWRWSTRRDRRPGEGRPGPPDSSVVLSAVGLPIFGFTLTFASFDWLMALHPTWHSSVFGVYYFAGAFLAALALLVLLVRVLETRGPLGERVAAGHYHALGRLLLTFVAFWAYIAYAQGFLIWIADIPSEAEFYLLRWEGTWKWVLAALVVGQFALPFALLLSRELKRKPAALAGVAAWLLFVHWLDIYWLVAPALPGADAWPGWEPLAASLTVVGLMAAVGAWRLDGHPAVPVGDPRLEDALAYESR